MADVQTVQLDTEWVKRLQCHAGYLAAGGVAHRRPAGAGVVLIVGNTIRLDILNRRAEIEVMKLVGASDGFARRPFLYSGIWYGLGGGLWRRCSSWRLPPRCSREPVEQLAGLYGSQFHLRGLGIRRGRGASGGCRRAGLAGLLACCDASYPRHRPHLSHCFQLANLTSAM